MSCASALDAARSRLLELGPRRTAAHDVAEAEVVALQLLEALIRRHGALQVLRLLEALQLDKLLTAAAGRRP